MAQGKRSSAARALALARFHGSGASVGQSRRSEPLLNFAQSARQGPPDDPPGLGPRPQPPPKRQRGA
eukprot:13479962-Alexandrium_andersonii.AAC.1